LRTGDAILTVINIGDITLRLADYMTAPAGIDGHAAVAATLAGQSRVPMQDLLIQGVGTTVLIDAGRYDLPAGSPYFVPGYTPPPELAVQLGHAGVAPDQVEHVVITHRHWDHFNGATTLEAGRYLPVFPNARHYLGRADWEDVQAALRDPASRESRALGVLHAAGLLEIVDEDREISAGITIIAAPGETSGHQIVRVHSNGETFYAVGDMYHHPIEIAHPAWMVNWASHDANVASRRRLSDAAVHERAGVLASHVPGIGRLAGSQGSCRWEAIRER